MQGLAPAPQQQAQPTPPPAARSPVAAQAPAPGHTSPAQTPLGQARQASPEEQALYERFVAKSMEAIFSPEAMPQYVKMLKGQGNPRQGLADATVQTVAMITQKAEAAGQKLPGDVVFAAAKEVLEELADLSKEAGIKDYSRDPDALEGAFFQAVDDFRVMLQQNGALKSRVAQRELAQLQKLDAGGGFESMLRALAANESRPARGEVSPRPAGFAGRQGV